ncbi:MAG: leucine--tRNA ligase [Magnetococcales bacterium]|nr:leucine--tRNA ligase [Magnetococcales bacterium]
MMKKYNPQSVEAYWQRLWEEEQSFRADEAAAGEKFYLLVMFPYPSGRIHMGHVRNYAIGDAIARQKRLLGHNVLQPMGWDAFGMPAENAAISQKKHPQAWTYDNIAAMRRELKSMGLAYDWSRELATCDPDYAHWEQRLFLKLHQKGLIYRKQSLVNWDPVDQTVLANEQVIDGKGWRSGAVVQRKELSQWFLKITHYADELLAGIETLTGWPETVRTMQTHWIGKSHGVEFAFAIEGESETLPVYTTRPDTIMGVTFCSIAPEHPLARRVAERDPAAHAFIRECQQSGTSEETLERLEKKGYPTGLMAIHPLTGDRIPIFIANFVLMSYGTGAVMAVPAHDQRDFEFARAHDLPIRVVIQPAGIPLDPETMSEAYTGPGILTASGAFDGLDNETAKKRVAERFEALQIGRATIQYRLRDWGISRQRYWGNPIPFIHCDRCGVVPVPETDLPVKLPEDVLELFGQPGNPLDRHPTWKQIPCPTCGQAARRETDTMDTFMESSWYFLRYCSPDHHTAPLDRTRVDHWMPVDQYVGGVEHAVLHLLYARFFHKALRDVGEVGCDEPFTRLLTQGMVRKDTHRCATHGWRYPHETTERDGFLICVECDAPIEVGRNEKMSKSKHNVVDPNEIIQGYGADTARVFMLFAAPPEQDLEWSDSGVDGAWRFLNRMWRLVHQITERTGMVAPASRMPEAATLRTLRGKIHETIDKVSRDMTRFQFNTAIAAVMELINAGSAWLNQSDAPQWHGEEAATLRELAETVVILMNPFAPHITAELWQETLSMSGPLHAARWPQTDPEALVRAEVTVVVQINGKFRSRITLPAEAPRPVQERMALEDLNIQQHLAGKEVMKMITLPGKLINIVVRP